MAVINPSVTIVNGTVDNSPVGGTTPSTGTFTTLTAQTEVLKGTGENLFVPSNTFTSLNTSGGSVTVTGSQSDPVGGSTAYLVVPTVTSSAHSLYNTGNYFNAGITTYTISVYVKASGYTLFYLSDLGSGLFACSYNLSAVTATPTTGCTGTITSVTSAAGWYRVTLTTTTTPLPGSRISLIGYAAGATLTGYNATFAGDGTSGVVVYGMQLEIGSTANAYVATSGSAVYGTPSLSFSGVAGLGLQSDGSLYVSPAGTGALQAQATTSSATGGNARGANAVDWQTSRGGATQVASGQYSNVLGGISNTSVSYGSVLGGGSSNYSSGTVSFLGGGGSNTTSGNYSVLVGGGSNTVSGYYNFIGGGFTNSGTSGSAVTTQSGTMNGTTAVTLSGSNASIKVGQYITGTSIAGDTYVAAISGTSLTLSKNASGSSTSTLSFYTPHGVVVGGGNNQATGSYSFIGGGGDAGTAGNRNVASGDWSTVSGGRANVASNNYSTVAGGQSNGVYANYGTISGGLGNGVSGFGGSVVGGYANQATGGYASILSGSFGTSRGIETAATFSGNAAISATLGVSQAEIIILGTQTTDATATVLRTSSAAASTINQVILPNNSAYYFRGEIIAGVTGAGDTKGWYVEGVIKRGAGVGTTAIVGTATVTSLYADAGAATWAVTATADTTNGGLKITVTGQASTTIRWVAQICTTEMTY